MDGHYTNIFTFNNGSDFAEYGCRIPSVWIWEDERFSIFTQIGTNTNYQVDKLGISLHTWYSFEIEQYLENTKVIQQCSRVCRVMLRGVLMLKGGN